MDTEPVTIRTGRPRKVALVQRRQRRATPLARRRRLNSLIRELALDFGLDLKAVSLTQRGVLHQLGTLLLQIEVSADQLVGGATVDADVCIRLTSEARRLLAGLRKTAIEKPRVPVRERWSPLRQRLQEEQRAREVEAQRTTAAEPEAAA
jgi:hypothetical protein